VTVFRKSSQWLAESATAEFSVKYLLWLAVEILHDLPMRAGRSTHVDYLSETETAHGAVILDRGCVGMTKQRE
jgi:hypothetical protein